MLTLRKNSIIEKSIILISIFFVAFLWLFKLYYSNTIAIMVLIINAYILIKARKNVFIFFLFLAISYFDYSVIISKYLFHLSNFDWIFQYIKYEDTLFVGISIVYLFRAIFLLLVNNDFFSEKRDIFEESSNEIKIEKKKMRLLILGLIIIIAFTIFDYLFFHIIFSTETIYEYLLIPIVITTYYSRNNKLFKRIILILILISAAVNIYRGERIASLSPLISYFFINYNKKINSKKMTLITLAGIVIYTFFGMYGDLLSHSMDTSTLRLHDLKERLSSSMFTLDTSYSSYWTGLTFIETRKIVGRTERVSNFIQYLTKYTLLGAKSKYVPLTTISRQFYPHWYGGYITCYFYYWLGLFGIILLTSYFTFLANKFAKLCVNSSDYLKMLFIYFISTVPRWYLYYPTSLIRGILLYSIVYFVFRIFAKKGMNRELNTNKN